ncbi:polysaccharide pyruvyl transferase WcaK-like protein [Microbacterium trichothecenolyticum]|uniref:polysaccharide pyruvyl transferase family protein n=1 Tax=Microbacterium trichothecenolyticum TaxID=69370 RepID=UPI002860514F|nr:polysaccharide pyruvyl transferase family protein [Microbacterium trichothecenolyticum]MDR7184909.1 polysaccharide pyruvyl transferase WcaK-like protein [Microbacterium trichothecenolyticum]
MKIGLVGGWGYNNLGDEAILAGYLEALAEFGEVVVSSHEPGRTSHAQLGDRQVSHEGAMPAVDVGVLGGGGYLNGSWVPEIGQKLRRMNHDLASSRTRIVSSVEVRGLTQGRNAVALSKLMMRATVSVRDTESAEELESLGVHAQVQPDGISLLVPHLSRYRRTLPSLRGKIMVNLLDIARRPDSDESELDAASFAQFADRVLPTLGNRAVGLVIGDGDLSFMRRYQDLPLITPRTVSDLVSALGSASGVLSVRMHPALLASALGTPTVSVAYCGKVRPTLQNIGVSDLILSSYEPDELHSRLQRVPDYEETWRMANSEVRGWLGTAIATAPSMSI